MQRGTPLRELLVEVVGAGKLLCPESDQEEEYVAERLESEVHGMFTTLSLGISLRHRQGVFDRQVFSGMQAYVKKLGAIQLPSSLYFLGEPVEELEERRVEDYVITTGLSHFAQIVRPFFGRIEMCNLRADEVSTSEYTALRCRSGWT